MAAAIRGRSESKKVSSGETTLQVDEHEEPLDNGSRADGVLDHRWNCREGVRSGPAAMSRETLRAMPSNTASGLGEGTWKVGREAGKCMVGQGRMVGGFAAFHPRQGIRGACVGGVSGKR